MPVEEVAIGFFSRLFLLEVLAAGAATGYCFRLLIAAILLLLPPAFSIEFRPLVGGPATPAVWTCCCDRLLFALLLRWEFRV